MGSNDDTLRGSIGLLVLRVGAAGLLFWGHGVNKLSRLSQLAGSFPDPLHVGSAVSLGLVVFAEVLCALFVVLGLFTRLALVPIMIMFVMIFFIHHAHDPFRQKELALVYLVSFVTLFLTGPGRFALDTWIAIRWGRRQ